MKKLLLAAALALFATSASAGEKRYGNWTYREQVDPVSNTVEASIYTKAIAGRTKWGQTPHMIVDCEDMSFGNLGVLDSEVFFMRHESKPRETFNRGHLSTDLSQVSTYYYGKSYWKSGRYKRNLGAMIEGGNLYVKFQQYSGPELIVTYTSNGFAQAVEHLAATCSR